MPTPPLAPWQRRPYAQAMAAFESGRLGHGLLFSGPAMLGKRALAERLAKRLLCTSPEVGDEACGHCRSCQLFAAGTHPDYALATLELNKEGTRLRTEIVIEQIRALSERMALTPQFGGAQIVVLDPADAINHAACNALLKTLEEPNPGRYLWLISAHPARLPATIRSRCQRLQFQVPAADEAMAWLRDRGHAQTAVAEALSAARGHPGLAEAWLRDGGLELRREVTADLVALARGERGALETAQRWTAGTDLDQRLHHAADLIAVEAGREADATVSGIGLGLPLTGSRRIRTLATWFDAANRTRDLLRTTVRADLALTELLAQWRQLAASRGTTATASQKPRGDRR